MSENILNDNGEDDGLNFPEAYNLIPDDIQPNASRSNFKTQMADFENSDGDHLGHFPYDFERPGHGQPIEPNLLNPPN